MGNNWLRTNWRFYIFMIAVVIATISLFITNNLVKQLANEERNRIELWAEGIRQLSNLDNTNQDFSFIFQVIQNNTTVPVILTDENGIFLSFRNIKREVPDNPKDKRSLIDEFSSSHEPIVVTLVDGTKNYIYYKDSSTLIMLTYYPYIQIFVVLIFLLISYYAFSQARRAEQNKIWVGLAKETAHQLGTPTSSLMACLHILKDKEELYSISNELEKDILRLEKISDRFSKIGSNPNLEENNLIDVINKSLDYIKNRVSKNISFIKNYDDKDEIILPLNDTLIEWVIENLVKNSIDAIIGTGEITFSITNQIQVVYLDIKDNGKGISRSKFKKIFDPGYTTKSRGWGLGLTLSKRIIEEYHGGQIFINSSELNKGTTIRIVLPRKNNSVKQ